MGLFDKAFDGIAGAITGGALSFLGGERAREQTAASTREQMDFQREMRRTSYQDAMYDMGQAGLNPILAYQQGGAATPGGASYTASDTVSPAVSTAMAAKRANAENDLLKEKAKTERSLQKKQGEEAAVAEWQKQHMASRYGPVSHAAKAQADAWSMLNDWYSTKPGKAALAAEIAKMHLNPFASIFGSGGSTARSQ